MAKRYFNWKLLIVVLIGIIVLVATAYIVRKWQRFNRAESGLQAGIEAYQQQEWEEAASQLGRYLSVNSDDIPVLLKYAEAQIKITPLERGNLQQAISAYRTVLREDPNNLDAAKELTGIYLNINTPGEAELIASRYLEDNEDPELRRMLAAALASQRKFEQAGNQLRTIVNNEPDEIPAYEMLARLAEQQPDSFSESPEYWLDKAKEHNSSSALAYIIRGDFYLRNNDKSQALDNFEQAENYDLSDPNVQLRLAEGYIRANELERAEDHLESVRESDPKNTRLWQNFARLALSSGSPDQMSRVAESALKHLSSESWGFMPTAAELFIRAGELERGEECIEKLKQKEISVSRLPFLEGLCARERGDLHKCVEHWKEFINSGNGSPQVRMAMASVLQNIGDIRSSISQLRTLVSENPNYVQARFELARALAQRGNWAQVIEQTNQILQTNPGSFQAALMQTQAQIQLLQTRPANEREQIKANLEQNLNRLEQASPDTPQVKFLRFQLAMSEQDYSTAREIVDSLKTNYGSDGRVLQTEVQLLVSRQKTEEAISLLKSAIEEYPQQRTLVEQLAGLLLSENELEQAIEVVNNACQRIQSSADTKQLTMLLAELNNRADRSDKASELLTSLSEKYPDDINIKRSLLRQDKIINDPQRAQQLVDDIKALEGESGWQWRYEQARLYFNSDDFESNYTQIFPLLEENLRMYPDDQQSRMLLAATHEKAGNLQTAISLYQEALDRSPGNLRIIIPTVTALYKANKYQQADQIIQQASRQELYSPQLQRLQVQSYLRNNQLASASDTLQDIIVRDPNNREATFSLAMLKMNQGEFDQAGELLQTLKTRDPNSLTVTSAQVQLNLRRGNQEKALQICDQTVNNLNNASGYILRAKTYAQLQQNDKAVRDFEQAAELEPNNSDIWLARSNFYYSTGQIDRAVSDIEKALELDPDNLQIQGFAASVLLDSNDRELVSRGRSILDKALESNPDSTRLKLLKARSLLMENTAPAITEASSILEQVTDENPQNPQAWLLLGRIALRRGNPGDALDFAVRGLTENSDHRDLLTLKAQAEAANSPRLAIPTYRHLLELDPNDVSAAVNLANTYLSVDEIQKALDFLEQKMNSVTELSQKRRLELTYASALYRSGRKDEAQQVFQELSESAPDDSTAFLEQIRLFAEDNLWDKIAQKAMNWYEDHPDNVSALVTVAQNLSARREDGAAETAEKILTAVLEDNENQLQALNSLAILMQSTGRRAEAAEIYQRILELQPENVIAMNNLAWIKCNYLDETRQALELANRGLKISPNYTDLIDTRGVICYQLGQYQKALEDFRKAIELYSENNSSVTATYLHLANTLAKTGQEEQALENVRKSLTLNDEIGGLTPEDEAEAEQLLRKLTVGGTESASI